MAKRRARVLVAATFICILVMRKITVADDVRSELDELRSARAHDDGQQDSYDESHEAGVVCDRSSRNGKRRCMTAVRDGSHDSKFSVVFEGLP